MTTAAPPLAGCPSGLAPASADAAINPAAFVRRAGNRSRLSLTVRGAKCGGCLSRIEGAVSALGGVEQARMNLSNGRLDVEWTGNLDPQEVSDAVSALGYGVAPLDTSEGDSAHRKEERNLLLAMGVAGFATANIMLLSVSVWGGHGEMGEATRQGLHAISGLIALPTLLFSGQPFFRSALAVLKRGRTNMDVPISLALILAFSVSVAETIRGGEHAYFDAACMLLFFLLIGRFLDARVRRSAYAAARDLAASQTARSPVSVRTVSRSPPAPPTSAPATHPPRPRRTRRRRHGIESGASEIDKPRHRRKPAALATTDMKLMVKRGSSPNRSPVRHPRRRLLLSDIARMLRPREHSTYRRIADKAVSFYVPIVHTERCSPASAGCCSASVRRRS